MFPSGTATVDAGHVTSTVAPAADLGQSRVASEMLMACVDGLLALRRSLRCVFCHICGPAENQQWKKDRKTFWREADCNCHHALVEPMPQLLLQFRRPIVPSQRGGAHEPRESVLFERVRTYTAFYPAVNSTAVAPVE